MKLPKSFTTVTPLSKMLALLLFILFPIVGFAAGMEYQKSVDPLQGADPRTQLFQTQEECESFTDRKCISTVCENTPTRPCVSTSGNTVEWFATRQPLTSDIQQSGETSKCDQQGGTWDAEHNECLGVNQATCEQIGGTYDECASPCRHDPNAEVCTLMCVGVCTIDTPSPKKAGINVDPLHASCMVDADCAIVVDTCTSCTCGQPVNIQYEDSYVTQYENLCSDHNGPVCDFYCETPNVACINNVCTLVKQ